jgi:hypothetical protein
MSNMQKNTQLDVVIPNNLCHPQEHKVASINYLMNRLHSRTYPITNKAKKTELNVIKNTLRNNKYNTNQIKKHCSSHEQNTNTDLQHQKTKWTTFTYNGKETRKIEKLFKETQIKIAYEIEIQYKIY